MQNGIEKAKDKASLPSTKRKTTTKRKAPISKGKNSKKKGAIDTVYLPGIENEPSVKFKVSVFDAKPGQPISPSSDLGEMKAIRHPKSKRTYGDTVKIKPEKYGVIKEIYIKKGDVVTEGQPFALIEPFDEREFPQRFDEYVTVADSCSKLYLVEYPKNFESKYPEILRRAAKLMTAFYYDWNDDFWNRFASPRDKKFAITRYDVFCTAEPDPEPEHTWSSARSMFFGGDRAKGLQIWFEDDVLEFGALDSHYWMARYERRSLKDPFRHSNVLRWVFEMERAISKDSGLGDGRVTELYEIIELEDGIERLAVE